MFYTRTSKVSLIAYSSLRYTEYFNSFQTFFNDKKFRKRVKLKPKSTLRPVALKQKSQ